jgi:Tectonin domain
MSYGDSLSADRARSAPSRARHQARSPWGGTRLAQLALIGCILHGCAADISEHEEGGEASELGSAAQPLEWTSPTWSKLPGSGMDVSVSPEGEVWLIGMNQVQPYGFSPYVFANGRWQQVDGAGVRLNAAPGGVVWILNNQGEIFRRASRNAQWVKMPGCARDISTSSNNVTWAIGCNAMGTAANGLPHLQLYKWNGSNWVAETGSGGLRVAVDPSGEPWVVNGNTEIWRRRNGSWTKLPGTARDISINSHGDAFISGTDVKDATLGFGIYVMKNGQTTWQAMGTSAGMQLGANADILVVTNGRNEIWKAVAPKPPTQPPEPLKPSYELSATCTCSDSFGNSSVFPGRFCFSDGTGLDLARQGLGGACQTCCRGFTWLMQPTAGPIDSSCSPWDFTSFSSAFCN